MVKSILSSHQKQVLDILSAPVSLIKDFYFTGGTALCEFYIPYRISEDLDFFSEIEFATEPLFVYLTSLKDKLKYRKLDFNTSFNRNIFQMIFLDGVLKIEFTYFPFPRIAKGKNYRSLVVDSPLDIAVNKLFTIYQKPRARDYLDLYMLNKEFGYQMPDLIKKAKVKFDWHIDPVKLGSQFLSVQQVKDYPVLIRKIPEQVWQNYFLREAKKLQTSIFKVEIKKSRN